jgi:rfaE bifunctional protein kinase chain/domain
VIRIDYEGNRVSDGGTRKLLSARALEHAPNTDAIIISDYNYGVADGDMSAAIARATRSRNTPVLVDSRFQLSSFPGFTSATPNEEEVEHVYGKEITDAGELESAGEQMRERLGYRALLVTRGGMGMVLFEAGVAPLRIEAIGAREPVDVTGAGDTVIATYALALASDASFPDAARLANYAGGLVVMKRGTATITPRELEHSILYSELS